MAPMEESSCYRPCCVNTTCLCTVCIGQTSKSQQCWGVYEVWCKTKILDRDKFRDGPGQLMNIRTSGRRGQSGQGTVRGKALY